jgi:hypothetical protein
VICEDRPGKLGFFDSILILIQILTSRTVSWYLFLFISFRGRHCFQWIREKRDFG